MIIVAGCSWSLGEHNRGDLVATQTLISHGGINHYIKESGQPTINLGISFGSNLEVAHKISAWVGRNPDLDISKILVFQTDYTRDYSMIYVEDYDQIDKHYTLPGIMMSRFYSRLSSIATSLNCTIYLIGGVSDTMSFDNIEDHYPGLKIACQSMTNLILNDQPNIENPVHSWYGKNSVELVKKVKQKLSTEELEKFLEDINRGFERDLQTFNNPEWFWPDGCHPNRKAHLKLYEYLTDSGIL